MAGLASLRETLGQVAWIGCFPVLRHVTRRTIRKHAILPSDNCFVASLAFHRGVGSYQRKEIHMVADLLLGSEPALHDVALSESDPNLRK